MHKSMHMWSRGSAVFPEQMSEWGRYVISDRGTTVGANRKASLMTEVKVPDLSKVTVTQITTHCNSGTEKNIAEHTTRQTSKWIGYSSRSRRKIRPNKYLIMCSLSVYRYKTTY